MQNVSQNAWLQSKWAELVSKLVKYLEFYNNKKKKMLAYEENSCCIYGYNDDCHNGM